MKTVPASLATLLGNEVTTLSTAWLITRRDNRRFRFTTSTRDAILDFGIVAGNNDGGQLFKSSVGYNRTNIANNATLDVGNLEVVGAFDDEEITDADIRAGLFDYADVRIAFYDHADPNPDTNIIKMLRGFFSEATITTEGAFNIELRDVTQVITRTLGEHYSKECRADVGDLRCKVPVWPDIVQRSQNYEVGEYVRSTSDASDTLTPATVTNPDAESGTTGWTSLIGTLATTGSGPLEGSNSFTGGAFVELRAIQDVELPTGEIEFIDANQRQLRIQWLQGGTDEAEIEYTFLDADGDVIGLKKGTGGQVFSGADSVTVDIPRLSRYVRVGMHMQESGGSGTTNALIDAIEVDLLHDPILCEDFDDRLYVCTTAGTTAATQPTYDTGVGNTTTDGTAVFTTEEAWTRCFTVTQVDSARTTFQVSVSSFPESGGARGGFPNAVGEDSAWFAFGACFFETGSNIGLGTEIRDWTTDGMTGDRVVELFDPMPFDIQVGDKGRMSVGCDQRLSTCQAKFANAFNFVGEPYVPGQDVFGQYPDAPA